MADAQRWSVVDIMGLTDIGENLSDDEITLRAERSLVAAALLDDRVAAVLPSLASERDYLSPVTAAIHEALCSLLATGRAVESDTLIAHLRAIGRLTTIGGAAAIGTLIDEYVSSANAEAHARIVRESAHARRMGHAAAAVTALVRKSAPVEDIERAASKVSDAAMTTHGSKAVTMASAVESFVDRVIAGAISPGVSTGLTALDRQIGGLRPGQLIVLGACPAIGKSAFAQGLMHSIAAAESEAAAAAGRTPHRALFMSLEMSTDDLTARSISSASRVDLARLMRGDVNQAELSRMLGAMRLLTTLPTSSVCGSLRLSEIRAEAHRERARNGGLTAVIVDYIQLVVPEETRGDRNREREVAETARGLKLLASDLGCPVIALSQLNRGLNARKDKRPTMSDLRESGAIEQDADVILMLYRDEVYNRDTDDRGIAEVIVAKQRNGPTGTVRVRFDGSWCSFSDLPDDAPQSRDTMGDPTDPGEGLPMGDSGPQWTEGDE